LKGWSDIVETIFEVEVELETVRKITSLAVINCLALLSPGISPQENIQKYPEISFTIP
jgi:hypothetical protein